jgi:hypothetical protein
MRIAMAVLADFVSVTVGDKLNVLGIFDTIMANEFPCQMAKVVLAARVLLDFVDGDQEYPIDVRIVDEDGNERFRAPPGKLTVGPVPPGRVASRNVVFELLDLAFERPGTYEFVLQCGPATATVPLYVVELA